MNLKAITDFQEKVEVYGKILETSLILPAFLSFTKQQVISFKSS